MTIVPPVEFLPLLLLWVCFMLKPKSIIGPVKQSFLLKMIIVLSISLNMCFGCLKEPSHRDGSVEYPQHMFWLRNKKNNFQNNFQLRTLIWGPDPFYSFLIWQSSCWRRERADCFMYGFVCVDFLCPRQQYRKTCVKWSLKNRENKDLNDKW